MWNDVQKISVADLDSCSHMWRSANYNESHKILYSLALLLKVDHRYSFVSKSAYATEAHEPFYNYIVSQVNFCITIKYNVDILHFTT